MWWNRLENYMITGCVCGCGVVDACVWENCKIIKAHIFELVCRISTFRSQPFSFVLSRFFVPPHRVRKGEKIHILCTYCRHNAQSSTAEKQCYFVYFAILQSTAKSDIIFMMIFISSTN